jgi:hypothetical protein
MGGQYSLWNGNVRGGCYERDMRARSLEPP